MRPAENAANDIAVQNKIFELFAILHNYRIYKQILC